MYVLYSQALPTCHYKYYGEINPNGLSFSHDLNALTLCYETLQQTAQLSTD